MGGNSEEQVEILELPFAECNVQMNVGKMKGAFSGESEVVKNVIQHMGNKSWWDQGVL